MPLPIAMAVDIEDVDPIIAQHPDGCVIVKQTAGDANATTFTRISHSSVLSTSRNFLLSLLRPLTCVIADFDGTLAAGNQWREIEKRLERTHPHLVRHLQSLKAWYEEPANKPTVSSSDDWWVWGHDPASKEAIQGAWVSSSIHAMATAGWTMRDVDQVSQNIQLREGATDLLAAFPHALINSMGVENIIRLAVTRYAKSYENDRKIYQRLFDVKIASARLKCAQRMVIGHHLNVVTGRTKRVASERFIQLHGIDPCQVLTIGDSIFDLLMAPEGALRVFIVPPDHDDHADSLAFRGIEKIWSHTDVFLRSNSLAPLVELVKEAQGK